MPDRLERLDRVAPLNVDAGEGLAGQTGLRVARGDPGLLRRELEQQVSRPSPFTSSTRALPLQSRWSGWSSSPKQTLAGSTVVAPKLAVERIATGITPFAARLIGFVSLPGLMSTSTVTAPGEDANSQAIPPGSPSPCRIVPATMVSLESATETPRRSPAAPSEAVSLSVSVPLAQPPAGLTNTYAAPWEALAPTVALDAPATTVSPNTATESPRSFPEASLRVGGGQLGRFGGARPAAGRLDVHVGSPEAVPGDGGDAGRADDDRVARERHRIAEVVAEGAVRGGQLGRLGAARPAARRL